MSSGLENYYIYYLLFRRQTPNIFAEGQEDEDIWIHDQVSLDRHVQIK